MVGVSSIVRTQWAPSHVPVIPDMTLATTRGLALVSKSLKEVYYKMELSVLKVEIYFNLAERIPSCALHLGTK